MSPQAAQQACIGGGKKWQLEGAVGRCQSQSSSPLEPEVRVQFSFGAASQISVLYAAPEQLERTYDRIYAGIQAQYGKPQVDRSALNADCAASLAACLAAGQRPRGAVWHWPAGSIELQPVHEQDRALLELRYSRQERAAQ